MRRFFILFLLSLLAGACAVQNGSVSVNRKVVIIPDYIVAKADSIIVSLTGSDYFTKNFTFIKAGYFPEIDSPGTPVALGIGKFMEANSNREDNKYTVLYRFSVLGKDWIDEPIRFDFDSSGKLLYGIPKTIPKYLQYPDSCAFLVDKKHALAIAHEAGLEEGYGSWKIGFGWIHSTIIKKYAWTIDNCLTPKCGCPSNGHSIIIDPNTGAIIQRLDWICTP